MKYKLGYTEEECVAMEKEKRKGGGDRREGDGTMWQCMEHPAALSAAVFHRSFQFRNALEILRASTEIGFRNLKFPVGVPAVFDK